MKDVRLLFGLSCVALIVASIALLLATRAQNAALDHGRPRLGFGLALQAGAFVTPHDSECVLRVIGNGEWHYRIWRNGDETKAVEGVVSR